MVCKKKNIDFFHDTKSRSQIFMSLNMGEKNKNKCPLQYVSVWTNVTWQILTWDLLKMIHLAKYLVLLSQPNAS